MPHGYDANCDPGDETPAEYVLQATDDELFELLELDPDLKAEFMARVFGNLGERPEELN